MREADANRATYEMPESVGFYGRFEGLLPGEQTWLREHRDEIARGRLLDIGVGGGRTTAVLGPLAREYVGVDYAEPLVAAARERCPGVDLRHLDARDLVGIDDGSVDVALFSFNGIDYLCHEDRLLALREVARVLRPGGLFLFSTHNLDLAGAGRFRWPWPPSPTRRYLGRVRRSLPQLARHVRTSRGLPSGDGWALVNDEAHEYRLVSYYVRRDTAEQQLRDVGLEPFQCLDEGGEPARGRDTRSVYLGIAARRT